MSKPTKLTKGKDGRLIISYTSIPEALRFLHAKKARLEEQMENRDKKLAALYAKIDELGEANQTDMLFRLDNLILQLKEQMEAEQ